MAKKGFTLMKINKIANAPVYARQDAGKTSFRAFKLAPGWGPFITEIQSNASKKCVSNMDGDFFRKLVQDLKELNEGKVDLRGIAINMLHKFKDPSDVDVIVSKPYWGAKRPENTTEIYPATLRDSFIDLIIPEIDFHYSHKLGTQRRFYYLTDTCDDDFYFARKLWSNIEDNKPSPYACMRKDFTEALVKGFEDFCNNISSK